MLKRIFEPTFHNVSHKFCQRRNGHFERHNIYYRWPSRKWFSETDFVECFKRISHNKLFFTINRKVDCYNFSLLINQILKVG